MGIAEVEERRALPGAGVDVLGLDLGQARRVDTEDVAAQQGQRPGRDGAGEDPRQVQHPRPPGQRHRSGPARSLHGDHVQHGVTLQPRLLAGEPGAVVADRRCDAALARDHVLDVLRGHGRQQGLGVRPLGGVGEAERVQEPRAVVRVVGMGADPPVGGPEELGERREGLGRLPVDRLQLVVAEGDGHLQRVDEDPLSPRMASPDRPTAATAPQARVLTGRFDGRPFPPASASRPAAKPSSSPSAGRTSRSRWFTSRC